ncbi:MAG: hypothetical protein ACK5Z2_13295 [Bacteroidota bacterium]|jgi:hypothetical protein
MAFYTDQQIQMLADALKGSDKAQENLQRQGKPELILVHDVLLYDDERAMETLHDNGHDDLGLFVTAVTGDPYAVQALFDGKQAKLAMAAGAVLGDERSIEWLKKNGHKAYLHLADAVKAALSDDE